MISEHDIPDRGEGGGQFAAHSDAAGSVTALVAAGLPLESGLRALSEEAPSPGLRRTLRRMSDELAAGEPPDAVLSRGGRGLPQYVRGLVKAGVQTGQLGSFLEEFLLAVRRRASARRGYWMALMYPLLLLPLSLLAASALLAMIVPQFRVIFEGFGMQLPALTMLIIQVGGLFSPPVLLAVLVGIPLLPIAWQAMPLIFSRAGWTRIVQKLPLIGTPSRMRGMSEFCSLLGLLVSGGIPLHEALEATAEALQDPNLKSGARQLAGRVEAGESLQQGAGRGPHFPAELRSLFHWEGRGAAFGEMLRQAGSVFAARAHVQLGIVGMFFPPIILAFIGGLLAVTVVALFLPLIRLLNELS